MERGLRSCALLRWLLGVTAPPGQPQAWEGPEGAPWSQPLQKEHLSLLCLRWDLEQRPGISQGDCISGRDVSFSCPVQPILTLLKVILLVFRGTLISLRDNSLEIAVRPACSARGLSRLCCAMAVCVAYAGVVLRNLDVVFT